MHIINQTEAVYKDIQGHSEVTSESSMLVCTKCFLLVLITQQSVSEGTWKFFVLKGIKTKSIRKHIKSNIASISTGTPILTISGFSFILPTLPIFLFTNTNHINMCCITASARPATKISVAKLTKRQNCKPEGFFITHHVTVHIFLCYFGDACMSGSCLMCVTAGVCRWRPALGSCYS